MSLQVKRRGIFSSMPKTRLRNSKTAGSRVAVGTGVAVSGAVGGDGVVVGGDCVGMGDGGSWVGCGVGGREVGVGGGLGLLSVPAQPEHIPSQSSASMGIRRIFILEPLKRLFPSIEVFH